MYSHNLIDYTQESVQLPGDLKSPDLTLVQKAKQKV